MNSKARLQSYGLVVDPQNINSFNDVKVWEDRKKNYEEDLENQLASIGGQAAAAAAVKGGKDVGKAPPKGAPQ